MGGKLPLKHFTQIMDADYIVSFINENYEGMKSLGIEGQVLQFDNDLKYKSFKAKNFEKKNIKSFDWPPCSSDLSLIENAKGLVTSKLNRKDIKKHADMMDEVEKFKQTWKKFVKRIFDLKIFIFFVFFVFFCIFFVFFEFFLSYLASPYSYFMLNLD